MESPVDAVPILARLSLQTALLAFAFTGAGAFVRRTCRLCSGPEGLAFTWGAGYFVGVSLFLPSYLMLSRVLGARVALGITLCAMVAMTALEFRRCAGTRRTFAAVVALVLLYSLTNAAIWIDPISVGAEPDVWANLGSIHSGRYANYAIFVAEHGRVPWLAQNGAQPLLASVHLLLGVNAPLAALMAWIPISLAFLSLLVFGLFRAAGFSIGPCAIAAAVVMFGNTALSAEHVFVFDNGSPLAFIGYTDLILSVGTFLLACAWLRAELTSAGPVDPKRWMLPALLGLTWCWYAPQNIVIFAAAATATILLRRQVRRLAPVAIAFAIATVVGALQFGSLLPSALREDTGYWTQAVRGDLRVRPYMQTLTTPWTAPRWNLNQIDALGVYERTYAEAQAGGDGSPSLAVASLLGRHLVGSMRTLALPILGLVLLWAWKPGDRTWLALAAWTFAAGYAVAFGLELDGIKWWLTRFLVPGCALATTCLGFFALGAFGRLGRGAPVAWLVLLGVATFGPVRELVTVADKRFVTAAPSPMSHRLEVIAGARGPFECRGCSPAQ